jgi:hypothetical protein
MKTLYVLLLVAGLVVATLACGKKGRGSGRKHEPSGKECEEDPETCGFDLEDGKVVHEAKCYGKGHCKEKGGSHKSDKNSRRKREGEPEASSDSSSEAGEEVPERCVRKCEKWEGQHGRRHKWIDLFKQWLDSHSGDDRRKREDNPTPASDGEGEVELVASCESGFCCCAIVGDDQGEESSSEAASEAPTANEQ